MTGEKSSQDIAADQAEYLRNNPTVCATVSVRAGEHPRVRWNPTEETYEVVEVSGTGVLEVRHVEKQEVVSLFAENPVDTIPVKNATYSPPTPGTANVWNSIEEDDDNVVFVDEESN